MRRQIWLACVLVTLLWATPAKADTGVIVRTTNLPALQTLCVLPITCTVVRGLDGTLGQVFLVTTPLSFDNFLPLLKTVTGFVSAEVDQLVSLVGGLNVVPNTTARDVYGNTGAWDPVARRCFAPLDWAGSAENQKLSEPGSADISMMNESKLPKKKGRPA